MTAGTGTPAPPATVYSVAVRALCEFGAREGDLDLRFTAAPSAQEGVAGHRAVAARRPAGYRSEVALSAEFGRLVVRGRADGYDPARGLLEEVKTFKGDLARLPESQRRLHWAQAKVYGWLLCRQEGLSELSVALLYFDVVQQRETPPLIQRCSAAELRAHFEALCERFVAWADVELAHRAARDAALAALAFPHAAFRPGQRALAQAVYHGAVLGRPLLAQAPTGIGKTIATVFPLLKACPAQRIDKVFFLTARTSGRALALNALDTLRAAVPLPLRTLELVAKDKACEHPDKACHGASCPLARGFHDRLPAARAAAVAAGRLTRDTLRELALAHRVCPYHLGQELVRWSDVVVGDYNHFFDASALLHGLTLANAWRVGVLVDEAHNLVERARAMYSATLSLAALRALRAQAPAALKAPLGRLQRAGQRLQRTCAARYAVLDEAPRGFVEALQHAAEAMAAQLGEHVDAEAPGADAALLQFHFATLQFIRLLQGFGAHSLFDVTQEGGDTRLCLRNVVPAPFLAPRFAAAHSSVLFSATLTPWHFYADTLGLPADTAWLDVQAPFRADQLSVRLVREVSTRFRDRERSLAPIARVIATQFDAEPGNYLAFLSSFDYLEQAARCLAERHPHIPVWQQGRRMDEPEREAFLARFASGGRGVGFAVLGGAFGEAIDLAGTRLIGAFIATLGLPQFNPVNEELRRRLQATFGAGHDYAYLFPGIRKVVQAAGRVIRTPTDRGSVFLIDDRFARREVQALLPNWWRIEPGDERRRPTPRAPNA